MNAGEIYTRNKILDNFKYPLALIQPAQNQKQTKTGCLSKEKLLKLNIGAKVMLRVNIGIHDRLINDQTRNIRHTKFSRGSVCTVYVKFSGDQAGLKIMISSSLGMQNSLLPIEKYEP